MSEHEQGEAYLDDARRHRFALSRAWADGRMLMFIGLNPSTADENVLDPTMRRCVGFAQSHGYGGLWMANLFTFRATKPSDLYAEAVPNHRDADKWLRDMAKWCGSGSICCAWGAHGDYMGRANAVKRLLDGYRLQCLGHTKKGFPRHPLYLPGATRMEAL